MERWKPVELVLKKFNIKELLTTVAELDIFTIDFRESLAEYSNVRRKNVILDVYIDYLKEFADFNVTLGQLELLYVYARSVGRTWTIYELVDKRHSKIPNLNPSNIREDLERLLDEYNLISNVAVQLHDGAYWIRFNISDRGNRRNSRNIKTSITHFVHYQGTNSVAAAGISRWHSAALFKALSYVFEFDNQQQTALQDRKLQGLFQLFHDKNNPHFLPLSTVNNVLATASAEPSKKEDNEGILNLQKEEAAARKKYVNSKFGDSERPIVKKLVYEVETPFSGLEYAHRMKTYENETFKYRVVIQGPNVIDGLTEWVTSGIAGHPLPKYLANVRTLGKTRFLIKTKSRAN